MKLSVYIVVNTLQCVNGKTVKPSEIRVRIASGLPVRSRQEAEDMLQAIRVANPGGNFRAVLRYQAEEYLE